MSTITETQDRSVQGKVFDKGFRPQLFIVDAGAYDSNNSFGPGAPAIQPASNNLEAVTDRSGVSPCTTRGDYRINGNNTDFQIQISLDLSQADPFPGGDQEELRIRTKPLTAFENVGYQSILPPFDHDYSRQPLFDDVEILLIDTTGASAPTHVTGVPGANQELQARFLHGGELALVELTTSGATANTSALSYQPFANLFGATSEPLCLQITIRGSYRNDSPKKHSS